MRNLTSPQAILIGLCAIAAAIGMRPGTSPAEAQGTTWQDRRVAECVLRNLPRFGNLHVGAQSGGYAYTPLIAICMSHPDIR